MEIDKPQISILMAVYEPNLQWLKEQLQSLNEQTYENLKLYVRDDCSVKVSFEDIKLLISQCITKFSYEIKRNKQNFGSNKTFELLTEEADGEYFAYCDQDDVWLPEKLDKLEKTLVSVNALLVCSDVKVINSEDKLIANSITTVRHRHRFLSGDKVFSTLLTRNFVIGCTMLVSSKVAKEAVPFIPEMVHDHWIALYASSKGIVFSIQEPTILYRIHGGNQTGVLTGIRNKKQYKELRINSFYEQIQKIYNRFPDKVIELNPVLSWSKERLNYSKGKSGNLLSLWKLRKCNTSTTIFEMITLPLPDSLFSFFLKIARKLG